MFSYRMIIKEEFVFMSRLSEEYFCSNADDNMHCYQSCYKMLYDFLNKTNITMEQAEKDTGFIKDMATWQYRGIVKLAKCGLDVLQMDDFLVDDFILNPEKALNKMYGENTTLINYILNDSDVDEAISSMKEYKQTENIKDIVKRPEISDAIDLLEQGYFLIVLVNSRALTGREGYMGHFVILDNVEGDVVTLHNPGLPPKYNQKVSLDVFKKSWNPPQLIAVRDQNQR